MFIDEKRSWISENKMGVRASYKHFAATRLFSRQTPVVGSLSQRQRGLFNLLWRSHAERKVVDHERRFQTRVFNANEIDLNCLPLEGAEVERHLRIAGFGA